MSSASGRLSQRMPHLLQVNPVQGKELFVDRDRSIYSLDGDTEGEVMDYFDKEIALSNTKDEGNEFIFEDVVFDFPHFYIKIGNTKKSKSEYNEFDDSINGTYKKKALCLIFAVLSLYKERHIDETLTNTKDFRSYFSHAFAYIFGNREKQTSNILSAGSEFNNTVPTAIRIISKYSRCRKLTRIGDVIKVEKVT